MVATRPSRQYVNCRVIAVVGSCTLFGALVSHYRYSLVALLLLMSATQAFASLAAP